MDGLFRSGRSLKRAGTVLFLLGAVLIIGPWAFSQATRFATGTWKRTKPQASAWISNAVTGLTKATSPTPKAPVPPPPPQITLEDAKNTIPGVLKSVYFALNHGNPQSVGQHIQADIFNNHQKLDYICQPFSYRAHYIDSVVERPNQEFLVRVRTLFKPLRESAYLMHFGVWKGYFYIHHVEDDQFPLEKSAAAEAARRFVYAARAGEWDIVRGVSSADLDVDQLKDSDWMRLWASVKEAVVEDREVTTVANYGLKLDFIVRLEESWFSKRVHLQFEPLNGQVKVVDVLFDPYGPKKQITARNLEQQTLLRFGISPTQTQNRTHPAISPDSPSLEERQ